MLPLHATLPPGRGSGHPAGAVWLPRGSRPRSRWGRCRCGPEALGVIVLCLYVGLHLMLFESSINTDKPSANFQFGEGEHRSETPPPGFDTSQQLESVESVAAARDFRPPPPRPVPCDRGLGRDDDPSRFCCGPGTFRCRDGSLLIPCERVNDDYCDCLDGSDEPGTSACSSLDVTFHCVDGKKIPAAFVDDGVCDCCDGADEQLPEKCQPSCA